jgi:hypothetical protein
MRVAAFYHAYLDNEVWPDMVVEYLDALAAFEGERVVGAAGGSASAQTELRELVEHSATVVTVDPTSERGTMELARAWALTYPDQAIVYAHTKGASQPTEFNDRWRHSMTHHVVEGWEHCRSVLEEGYDAVGCHWLHPDAFGESTMGAVPFFGGNFWMARCSYLATLPPVSTDDRWASERWIGLGQPRIVDLAPGWPGDGVFTVSA